MSTSMIYLDRELDVSKLDTTTKTLSFRPDGNIWIDAHNGQSSVTLQLEPEPTITPFQSVKLIQLLLALNNQKLDGNIFKQLVDMNLIQHFKILQ